MHLGFALRVFCILQVIQLSTVAATNIGVIYGEKAALAAGGAENAVQSLRAQGISKVRLYDADSAMLRALGGSSIEVIVGLRNDELPAVGVSGASANSWIARNVEVYFPDTQITAIAVGDEVLTGEHESLVPFLVPAMRNIHAALSTAGLAEKVKVTTPFCLPTLSPPSAAAFDPLLTPVLDFLSNTGAFFMLNLHPSDVLQPNSLSLPTSQIEIHVPDLHYSNRFEALLDAVYVALTSLGHPQLNIVVSEIGWSQDSPNDKEAALAFLDDVKKHVTSARGTPSKPQQGAVGLYVGVNVLSLFSTSASDSKIVTETTTPASSADSGVRRRLLAAKTWCIAKDGTSTAALQAALDWACGQGGANCQPIQEGQFCFLPNSMQSHASYAFNSYYQMRSWASGSCDFGGLAEVTSNDPSYTGCLYASSGSDPTNTTFSPSGSDAQSIRQQFSLPLASLVFLITWKLTMALGALFAHFVPLQARLERRVKIAPTSRRVDSLLFSRR
ncbi:hypothetical protein R1sor_014609 [Riccia sorocarpa]|uniref:X8 domain-containing protein n=1 Tax=Riccia sorocarpa TaxID=122646 RepID=A0ABD3HD24_9MARC